MHYSSPFRLYLITDPETGRRYQRYGRKKGAALAEDIADRTQKPLETILTPSRCFYVLEYCRGGKRGRRVNTGGEKVVGSKPGAMIMKALTLQRVARGVLLGSWAETLC